MGTVAALVAYAVLLGVAAIAIWRRPVVVLYLFLVGLALHNAVMAALYGAGLRGSALTAVTAWEEILLAVALLRVGLEAWRGGGGAVFLFAPAGPPPPAPPPPPLLSPRPPP